MRASRGQVTIASASLAGLSRDACRAHAVQHCSLDAMVDAYLEVYLSLARTSLAAA